MPNELRLTHRRPIAISTGESLGEIIESIVTGPPTQQLDHAITTLDRRGWTQGKLAEEGPDGAVCLMGAIMDHQRAWVKTLDYVAGAAGVKVEEIDDWNDTPGRTQDEVREVLVKERALAAAAEAEKRIDA